MQDATAVMELTEHNVSYRVKFSAALISQIANKNKLN